MPSSVKKLYFATSMNDLDSKTEIPNQLKNKPTRLLVTSVNNLFKEAEKTYAELDEEKAYFFYARFIDLILVMQKRADFIKNDNKLLMVNVNTAISRAENLKESLTKRYSSLTASRQNEKSNLISELQDTKKSPVMEISPKAIPVKNKNVEKLTITSSELFEMMKLPQPSLIIMDTRHARDFSESHIKHSCCINIPQDILKPGITTAKLQSLLPEESLALWSRRADVDCVVLLDVDSKNNNTDNIHLNALKVAMSKWDQKGLKKNPMILEGGYMDWMSKYPMYTTQVIRLESMNDIQMSPILADLSDIEYPNLDENPIDDTVQKMNAKNSGDMLFKKSPVPNSNMNGYATSSQKPEIKKPYSAPVVDRRSKPQKIPNKSTSATGVKNGILIEKVVPPPVDRNLKNKLNSMENDVRNSLNKENIEIVNQKLKSKDELDNHLHNEPAIVKKVEFSDVISKSTDSETDENDVSSGENQDEIFKSRKFDGGNMKSMNGSSDSSLDELLPSEFSSLKIKENSAKKDANNQMKKEIPNNESHHVPSKSESRKADFRASKSAHATNGSESMTSLSRQSSTDSKGLVRSHSSPNIAQMVNDELDLLNKTIPVIDRSLKPKVTMNSHTSEINRARQRNLNPVYGNCPVRSGTGLRNLGNTCFMNSVIQCLSNTPPLAEYILSGQYVEHINRDNKQGTGGELIEEFAAVIRSLWMGQYKSFSPRDFKNTVSRCLAVCIGNEQQDSHEFLVVLMEKLNADTSRKRVKVIPKLDPDCSEKVFWQHHKTYNSSKVSEIFEGMLKSTLTCLSCRKTSNSFEVSSCLSLPILTSRCTLKECFKHFLKPEKISGEAAWDCPRCKQKKEAEKRLSICRLPEILVIQLKRFSYEGLWRRKLQTHVEFDSEFSVPYEENSNEYSRLYSLYGIVNHYGTLEGGHYTAYCKTNSGKWFKFDDHEVSEISSSDIKTSAAYLLFYITTDFQSHL